MPEHWSLLAAREFGDETIADEIYAAVVAIFDDDDDDDDLD